MKIKIILLIFAIVLMLPRSLFAKYQIEFTPSISLNEEYNDNLYLYQTNEKSDWITYLSPGVNLNIFSQKNNFSLNYSPSIVRYKNNDNNNTVRQNGSFLFNGSLTQHLEFNISDTYIKSEQPVEETQDIISVRRTRRPYQRNNGESYIKYSFGPANSFSVGYKNSLLENEDITLDNGTISNPYANYTYWFNVKHGMVINTGYTIANFTRGDNGIHGDDYSGFTQGIGYRYRFNPHTTLSADYNFTNLNFKGASKDYKVYEGTLGIDQSLTEDMSYHISAGYFAQVVEMAPNNGGLNFDLSFAKKFGRGTLNFDAKSGWMEAYLESERRGFTKFKEISTRFDYQVAEKLSNYASISYRQDKDTTGRKSETISTHYGWQYSFFRYYTMSLDYSCSTRSDDLGIYDYNVNRVMLILKWSKPYR